MESLEGQLKQCIKEKQGIESQLQDAVAKNSATDAALVMIGAFRDVCTSCRSCKRKCVEKGLMDDYNVYARKGCVLHRHLVFWKVVLVILIMEKHF